MYTSSWTRPRGNLYRTLIPPRGQVNPPQFILNWAGLAEGVPGYRTGSALRS